MAALSRRESDVGPALDADGLRKVLELRRAVRCFVALGVTGLARCNDPLEVEVLHVGCGVRETPGDVFVLPEHHERQPRQGCARHVQARCFEPRQVPKARRTEFEVGVVGEQGATRGAARAGDDPVVGARAFHVGLGQPWRARLGRRDRRRSWARGDAQAPVEAGVIGRCECWFARVRRQQLRDPLGGHHEREPQAQQFAAPVGAEVPGHHDRPAQAVDRGPVFGLDAKQQKFRRPGLQMLTQEGVDAGAVSVQHAAHLRIGLLPLCLGAATHAQGTQKLVGVERIGSEGFSQPPGGDALVRFKLPEPVLCVREAQAKPGVLGRRSADGRDAVRIALERQPGTQTARVQQTFGLGQGQLAVAERHRREQHGQHAQGERATQQPLHGQLTSRFSCRAGSPIYRVQRRCDAAARRRWSRGKRSWAMQSA